MNNDWVQNFSIGSFLPLDMKLSMYSRGGSIYKKSDSSGLVFLEKDWNGGRLPRDLIEEFGLIENSLSILDLTTEQD